MQTSRLYSLLIFLFWAGAMTWLVSTKVAPALRGGDRPQFSTVSDDPSAPPAVECWSMYWGERKVGWAATMLSREQDGVAETRSIVRFDELPLGEMMHEMFGAASRLFEPLFGGGSQNYEVPMTINSRMMFNSLDQLINFETTVDLYQDQRLATLRGDIEEGQLNLRVRIDAGGENELPEIQRQLDLSPDALVLDAFAPQTSLKPLWVGQTWTMRVYRPFPPNQPEQLIEGRVEELTEITWQGETVETFLVVYREDAGAGVTATREPLSRMWVARDGTVLKQEMALGGQKFVLVRMPEEESEQIRELMRRIMTM